MNYSININCKLKNIAEDKLSSIKSEFGNLNNLFLCQNEKVAYYYEDINTGSVLSYNSDILFYAASSIKILVCLMLLEKAENKETNLEDKLLITSEDLKHDSVIQENTYYTLKDLIKYTIVESDNTAYIKLVNFVGKENLEEYGKSLGAHHTMEGKDLFGLINCDDMITYWKKIKDFIEHSKYGKDFYNWLSNPTYSVIKNEAIGNNKFVKKYGSWDIAYHEAGYVDSENPFYLIILTQKYQCNDKDKFINNAAKTIYNIHNLINK